MENARDERDENAAADALLDCPQYFGTSRNRTYRSLATLTVALVRLLEGLPVTTDAPHVGSRHLVSARFDQFEADLMRIALVHTDGQVRWAAKMLNTDPETFRSKMKLHGIEGHPLSLTLAYLLSDDSAP